MLTRIWKYGMINISKERKVCFMKMYKVYYKSGNGTERYTYVNANSEQMIRDIVYCVQGMCTEVVSYEEVINDEEKNL